jgi:hypothetical protein
MAIRFLHTEILKQIPPLRVHRLDQLDFAMCRPVQDASVAAGLPRALRALAMTSLKKARSPRAAEGLAVAPPNDLPG